MTNVVVADELFCFKSIAVTISLAFSEASDILALTFSLISYVGFAQRAVPLPIAANNMITKIKLPNKYKIVSYLKSNPTDKIMLIITKR